MEEEVKHHPVLKTERLFLRGFEQDDARDVQRLAGDYEVARTTNNIPHPYPDGAAEQFIASRVAAFAGDAAITLGIFLDASAELVGCVGVTLQPHGHCGELGYWIGRSHWGKGYATEAGKALVDHTFQARPIYRMQARHMVENAASGKVLEKLGFQLEGCLRSSCFRFGRYHDVYIRALLRPEWELLRRAD